MALRTSLFDATPPREVPLPHAPLVRVIAQLRFPEVLSIEQREAVAPFQEALRSVYPVLRAETGQTLAFGPSPQLRAYSVWRFFDSSDNWRVSLASNFLALETTQYSSRDDFMERLGMLTAALVEHIGPSQLDRIGLRYIDRVTDADLTDIVQLVHPDVRGIVGGIERERLQHSMCESVFNADDGAQFLTRWGYLPPNATYDEGALEPIPKPSWVLDLDMFRAATTNLEPERVIADARRFAEQIYKCFRWAVTDQFLVRYGGRP